MRITAIRIRVLRSRETGYGHDAAEIEAQVEEGDDPEEVARELQRKCEAQVRQSADGAKLIDHVDSLRSQVVTAENHLASLKAEAAKCHGLILSYEQFINAAQEKGIDVPNSLLALTLPF